MSTHDGPEDITAAEFTDALEAWLNSALSYIEENFNALLVSFNIPRWYLLPDGTFRKFPVTFHLRNSLLEENILKDSPEWKRVEAAASEDASISKLLRRMTALGGGSWRQFSLFELCSRLLPVPQPIDGSNVEINTKPIGRPRISEFVNELHSDSVTSVVVWPISGISTDHPILLEKSISFRPLTGDEILIVLNFGMIAFHHETTLRPENANWFGLILATSDKRYREANEDYDLRGMEERQSRLQNAIEDFFVSSSLATEHNIEHAGFRDLFPHIEYTTPISQGHVGVGIPSGNISFYFSGQSDRLSDSAIAQLKNLWCFLRSPNASKRAKRAVVAARRIRNSTLRSRSEDALIDLMIAAEAIYLDDENIPELKFRLSASAALLSSSSDTSKREVFELFRAAYDLRSKIVHGGIVDPSKISTIVDKLRPIMKRATVEIVDREVSKKRELKFDELLFPQEI